VISIKKTRVHELYVIFISSDKGSRSSSKYPLNCKLMMIILGMGWIFTFSKVVTGSYKKSLYDYQPCESTDTGCSLA